MRLAYRVRLGAVVVEITHLIHSPGMGEDVDIGYARLIVIVNSGGPGPPIHPENADGRIVAIAERVCTDKMIFRVSVASTRPSAWSVW